MADTEFEIAAPCRHQIASIGSDGRISVAINDFGFHGYSVSIYYFPFGPGGQRDSDGRSISLPTLSGVYTTSMPINTGDLGPDMNRYIEVTDNNTSDVQGFSFRAVIGGSGAFQQTPPITLAAPAVQKFGQVVPQAMTLKLDTKVTPGTCAKCADLNKPALLQYSGNGWLSQPIAFCGKGAPSGLWVLKRSSATTWSLELKQDDKTHVTFVAKVKAKDYTFPLKLERSGPGSKVCKAWPKSITLTVA